VSTPIRNKLVLTLVRFALVAMCAPLFAYDLAGNAAFSFHWSMPPHRVLVAADAVPRGIVRRAICWTCPSASSSNARTNSLPHPSVNPGTAKLSDESSPPGITTVRGAPRTKYGPASGASRVLVNHWSATFRARCGRTSAGC
jgi:hypothetical protein